MPEVENLNLDRYRWKNRLVLLFAADATDATYREQRVELDAEWEGFRDRDAVIFHFLTDGGSFVVEHPDGQRLAVTDEVAIKAFHHYSLEEGTFALLLIGKDGSKEHHANTPLPAKELFALIDAMPMRQEELRQQGVTDE